MLSADYQSGASSEAGVLSVPDAGAIDLRTYDPDRLLDPLATESPFFGSIRPGTPIRLVGKVPGVLPAWTGYLDEGRYELATATGRLRAVDGIAYLAQAEVPDGTVLPNTLRARVRAVIVAVGLASVIPVQPEAPATVELVPNGGFEPDSAGWTAINGGNAFAESAPGDQPDGSAHRMNVYQPTAGGAYPGAVGTAFPIQEGVTYTVSAQTRAVGTPRNRAVRFSVLSPDGLTYIAAHDIALPPAETDGLWRAKSAAFVADPGAGLGRIELYILEGGPIPANDHYALFDQVSVRGPNPDLYADPPVAAFDGKSASAWSIIQTAALDALTYIWLDGSGTLRFTAWGSLPDASYSVGCDDGLGGVWLDGLASLESTAQADPIRNSIRSWASASTYGAALKDAASINRYGERRLDVARIVPNAAVWAQRILDDRADAGLEVTLGELRPYTALELGVLLGRARRSGRAARARRRSRRARRPRRSGARASGRDHRERLAVPSGDDDPAGRVGVRPSRRPSRRRSRRPAPTTARRVQYVASSDALLALTSGGAKYGAGASTSLPVGVW